jgi:hypothetical protein
MSIWAPENCAKLLIVYFNYLQVVYHRFRVTRVKLKEPQHIHCSASSIILVATANFSQNTFSLIQNCYRCRSCWEIMISQLWWLNHFIKRMFHTNSIYAQWIWPKNPLTLKLNLWELTFKGASQGVWRISAKLDGFYVLKVFNRVGLRFGSNLPNIA